MDLAALGSLQDVADHPADVGQHGVDYLQRLSRLR